MSRASDLASYRILSGPLALEVARFGTPLALGMGLQTTFNLVDAYLIGQLSPEVAGPALGAIGICDQLAALGTIVSYGLTVSTGALISRSAGRGDREGVRSAVWQSMLLVAALSVAFGVVGLFGARWLVGDAVGAKGAVVTLGVPYLQIMLGGSFSIFLLLHLTSVLRALGSSKTPVLWLVGSNALNLLLAPIFIYGPGEAPGPFSWAPALAAALGIPRMELEGAAWATLLARSAVLLPLAYILIRRFHLFPTLADLRPVRAVLAQIWRVGWPSSAQLVVRILAMLFTHALVARAFTTELDQTATTALGIVFRLETMALFVGLGWGSAAQTFVGQNLGATNAERAKSSGWYAAFFNACMMAGLAILYRSLGPSIIGFFDSNPEVIAAGMEYFRWVGPSYVALGVGIVLGSAIQGAGATRQALLLDASVVLLFQLPLSLVAVLAPNTTTATLWQVVALTYLTFALVHVWAYRRGRFLRTVVA
jgi:putative MATE family efflux protein